LPDRLVASGSLGAVAYTWFVIKFCMLPRREEPLSTRNRAPER
jgi:hypothetical protein